jgi:hypothetical protein
MKWTSFLNNEKVIINKMMDYRLMWNMLKYIILFENISHNLFFQEFVDRIVIIDSPGKIHSLFNFEQSHVFGLR